MSDLIDDTVDKIIDCCRRITEADPQRDLAAENELYGLGELAFGLGYEDSMRQFCDAAAAKAMQKYGRTWGVNALCNSTWNGIGSWQR